MKIVAIFDVDGVLTDGTYLYSEHGKVYKIFGPDDAYALNLISNHIDIKFCSSDKRGFSISKKRVNDMGYELSEVSYKSRLDWINENFPENEWFRIYMGDSFTDAKIFKNVNVGICPRNAHPLAKQYAQYITKSNGGNRAVTDAVFWIIVNVLKFDLNTFLNI